MDLTIEHGATKTFALVILQGGANLDLTGKVLRFSAKRDHAAPGAPLIAKSTGAGIVHDADQPGVGKGKATLTLLPADTSALPNRRQILRWDVQVEDGANRYPALVGRIEVAPEVSVA